MQLYEKSNSTSARYFACVYMYSRRLYFSSSEICIISPFIMKVRFCLDTD